MTGTSLTRRRFVGLGLASAAAVGTVTSCSKGPSSSGGQTTITFSYLWTGQEAKALESVIARFNASQRDIVVKGVSNPDSQAQLAAMTGSKGAFDISDNFGTATGDWASKGIIRSLEEYIQRDKYDISDFVPSALDACRYQKQVYQLPIAVNNYALFYNKTLFAKAGISNRRADQDRQQGTHPARPGRSLGRRDRLPAARRGLRREMVRRRFADTDRSGKHRRRRLLRQQRDQEVRRQADQPLRLRLRRLPVTAESLLPRQTRHGHRR
jgi:hypothetical protein